MSLNWSITDVKDWQSINTEGREATVTNTLIWATLTVGLPGITSKNVDEFCWRIGIIEQHDGAFLQRHNGERYEEVPLTREDITRRIGLSTNVSTESRTVWLNRQLKRWARDSKLDAAAQKALKASILATAPATKRAA